ncbi:MAG: TIGR02996 domain-containing protein [Pirellulales bacterium]|nr:TIGR02996 domain-containing protein [Pirellulales bacterium]
MEGAAVREEYLFIQQIREDPTDDIPRLIFADFLEEAGDEQGELIRVQVELSRVAVGDPRRAALIERERALLDEFGDRWLAPMHALGVEGASVRCFQRGLIERVRIPASRFLESGLELCQITPALHCIELTDITDVATNFAAFPLPAQITAIDFSSKRLEAEHISAMFTAGWWRHISRLDLRSNLLEDEGVLTLTEIELPALKYLSLDFNNLGPDAAAALAAWPSLGNVEHLSLSVNSLGDVGVQRLMNSAFLGSIKRLDLASNRIAARGVRHLAKATVPALRELNLRSNSIDESGMRSLVEAPFVRQLTGIDVRGNADISQLQHALPQGVVRPLT